MAGGLYPQATYQSPDFYNVYGHSYWQYNFGTRTQAGRADALFRAMLDIEFTNFVGHATNGARLSVEGLPQGGFGRLLQNVNGSQMGAPYAAQGGAYLLGWGINDLGYNTDTQQMRDSYAYCLRAMISRCRMSTLRDNNYAGAAGTGVITYGASWTSTGFTWDWASGTTVHQCTTAANDASHTITITLPTDYTGTPITVQFNTNPGVVGGTITWGGTAGVTGTSVISNIQPAASLNHAPFCRRITTLTSANAGQTITMVMTQVDAGGIVYFDGYWIESTTPGPVLVCNIAKLTSTGYAVYPTPPTDAQVDTWNTMISGVVAEFDSMVQLVDVDAAIDKANLGTLASGPTLASDGLHPTEFGAARIADKCVDAVRRLRPTTIYGPTAHINPQSARSAALVQPYYTGGPITGVTSKWYTTETSAPTQTAGTAYTCVSGDMWAMPFYVSQGQMQATQWCVEKVTSTVATTVFMCIFDDRQYRGYPQYIHANPANSTALSIVASVGVFTSSTTPGANGYLLQPLDPGLYWLVLKIVTAGTTTLRTLTGQSRWMPNLVAASGAGNVSYNAYKLTGQGTGAMSGSFPSGGVESTNCPYIGLKLNWLGQP